MLLVEIVVGYLENIVSLAAVFALWVVVDERVVLINHFAVAVGLLLDDALVCLLEFGFQHNHLQLFLMFCIRIVFQRVCRHNYGAFVIVAEIISEIVVKLGVVDFFLNQLVLQLEDG